MTESVLRQRQLDRAEDVARTIARRRSPENASSGPGIDRQPHEVDAGAAQGGKIVARRDRAIQPG